MDFYLLFVGAILGVGLMCMISSFMAAPRGEPNPNPAMVYDYEVTRKWVDLRDILGLINSSSWELIAVTQDGERYTVFFRRPLHE